jgi:hypothetical protein
VGVTVDANGRSWSVRVNDLANFTNRLALDGEYLFVGGFETGGPATVGRPGARRWRCAMRLEGRSVLLTGATGGIGSATLELLAKELF